MSVADLYRPTAIKGIQFSKWKACTLQETKLLGYNECELDMPLYKWKVTKIFFYILISLKISRFNITIINCTETNSHYLIPISLQTDVVWLKIFQTMNSVRLNNLGLEYQRFTQSVYEGIGNRNQESMAKN